MATLRKLAQIGKYFFAMRGEKKGLNSNMIYCLRKSKGVEKISVCFDNNMINFDFKDKHNFGFLCQ